MTTVKTIISPISVTSFHSDPGRRRLSFLLTITRSGQAMDKVLVIYTGGTIGMVPNRAGVLTPSMGVLYKHIRHHNQMHDENYYREFYTDKETNLLVLPDHNNNSKRVFYEIKEWENPVDSTNISVGEWVEIAKQIKENYDNYCGFVILHGTDTMAYTAAALSMILEGLRKPVVITGAQIPIFQVRTDGIDNFKSSLIIAGTMQIPEVTLFFHNVLLRGNRATKISNCNFTAFQSPNYEPLATLGINIKVSSRSILSLRNEELRIHPMHEHHTVVIHFYPGITIDIIKKLLEHPTKGAILVTYGSGNIPSNSRILHEELEKASNRGVILVNITQCLHGSVQKLYETGKVLMDCNVLPGYDMTIEAAYVKLLHVLSNDEWDIETKRHMMTVDLRGELTSIDDPH